MTTPIPLAALGAPSPTSRSVFRLLVRGVGATNREADSLRVALLARWDTEDGSDELVFELQSLDQSDPDGSLGLESRLSVWFSPVDPGDGQLVSGSDPILTGLPDELRARLSETARPERS